MKNETGRIPDEFFSDIGDHEEKSGPVLVPQDRPRGILTQADREYLCGLKDYAHAQSESNRKQEIRERVKNGLKDFGLLWFLLGSDERRKIFDELGEEDTNLCIQSMITFAYLGLEQDRPRLEKRIEHGVLRGANFDNDGRWDGGATNVDVSINIEYGYDIDNLYEQVQEGNTDQLSASEIGALVQAGKLDSDDLEILEENDSGFTGLSLVRDTEDRSSSSGSGNEQ